jgi:glycosyltransferase involved in cell wall biosynthesis/LmbE family N-acetylglucosaminyl deacetylase/SAM-dependent methyltransferase
MDSPGDCPAAFEPQASDMNICFPSLSYPMNGGATSGVGSQVRMLAHGLIEAGNSISVVDLADRDQVVVTDDRGAEVHRMRGGNLHWFAGKVPFVGKFLALPIREIEYSVAVWRGVSQAHKIRKLDLIEGTETGMLLVAMFSRSVPVIIRLHGEQYTFHKYTPGLPLTAGVRLSRVLQRIALRRAKLLISPSFAHAREIQRELGVPHPPIVVVPNGLSIQSVERDLEIQRSAQTVLYVGRIERLKGISTLLQAASQTRESLPQTHFVFAGDFHSSLSEIEFRSLVHQHGLDSHVVLLGSVGWKVLSEWYQRSTISVLPSHYETFGVAALEPMAFGTPVIATSGGALSEVVESDVSGKLVAAGDSRALAGALTELLENANSREQMSQAAVERAAIFDSRRVLPLNSRPYEWCCDTEWSAGSSHLFFSPHLDDAVLSCGGMIHSLVSQNKSVQVITVFAGDSDENHNSAFARHLHAKWGATADLFEQRRQEDAKALSELGVTNAERWSFPEAPYRLGTDGSHLYGSYDELRGQPAREDRSLKETITERILTRLQQLPDSSVLYFPLSLGRHVDHQLLFAIGLQLSVAGKQVRFYEDYPYAEAYDPNHGELNWLPRTVSIDFKSKLKAASAYATQLPGLGGSVRLFEKRLRAFGAAVDGGSISERYWEVLTPASADLDGKQTQLDCPLVVKDATAGLRDFKNFLRTFRWHDLEEVLPVGQGRFLDLGCGAGRHRALIESKGYQWLGLDRAQSAIPSLQSDVGSLPLQSESMAAVSAWQVFEYVDCPEAVVSEAARVLESGGVFCGSVSFLEPVHGRSCFNLSPLILEKLLARHGFADIEIKPGLNGFALMLWTWLRRSGVPFVDRLAIPAALALLAPASAVMFFSSWSAQRLGIGSGHTMRWLSQTSLLEFAGHVMFTARKKGRAKSCTSVS